MSLKARISSPLEAGTSLLDTHNLPPHLTSALEYASQRLARKSLHVALVVVRREFQLPESQHPADFMCSPPTSPAPAAALAPSLPPPRLGFASTIKHLVRVGTHPVLPSLDRSAAFDLQRSATVSPTLSMSSVDTTATAATATTASSRLRWPLSPMSVASSVPMTPATPATTASSVATDAATQAPNAFGIRLVHTDALQPKHDKMLRQTIEKAGRKFGIGTDWLPMATGPESCGVTPRLMRRSIVQNEVLFSSEGLTLLSLDHLYTFKCALASYAETAEPWRLEDAVDELRRYVLANGRRKLPKSQLLRTYDGLTFTEAALADVRRMYRRAYGGVDQEDGVERDGLSSSPVQTPEPEPQHEPWGRPAESPAPAAVGTEVRKTETPRIDKCLPPLPSPTQKGPVLRLQTNFDKPVAARRREEVVVQPARDDRWDVNLPIFVEEASSSSEADDLDEEDEDDDDEEEQLTARPREPQSAASASGRGMAFWGLPQGASIDEMLLTPGGDAAAATAGLLHPLGPTTPNGYDDISPITRGEWGFLIGNQMGREVTVTTC